MSYAAYLRSFVSLRIVASFIVLTAGLLPCRAQSKPDCSAVPDAARLRATLQPIVRQGAAKNGGLGNQEWAVVVNRDGVVCAIVFSGSSRGDQWPGSRVIAASKANTANGLSGNDYALSTANGIRGIATRAESLQPGYKRSSECKRGFRRPRFLWLTYRPYGGQSHWRHHRVWRWPAAL